MNKSSVLVAAVLFAGFGLGVVSTSFGQSPLVLDLSYQSITNLDEYADLEGLEQVEEVNLSGNTIDLRAPFFARLKSCRILYLRSANIQEIPKDFLEQFENLEEVSFERNNIEVLPECLGDSQIGIKAIDLGFNKISRVPEGLFRKLVQLEEIWLHKNSILQLPEMLFHGLTMLQVLSLNNNNIKALPVELLAGLKDLNSLYIAHNQLTSFPVGFFKDACHLEELFFNNNHFVSFPHLNLAQLRIVGAHGNAITAIEMSQIQGLPLLSMIYLAGNLAEKNSVLVEALEGRGIFVDCGSREYSLSELIKNGIARAGHFRLGWSSLTLSGMRLTDVRGLELLFDCQKVTSLQLDCNKLSQLDEGVLLAFPKLEVLYLGHNKFAKLPEHCLRGLGDLLGLFIQHNKLACLPVLSHVKRLQRLWVGNNELSAIPSEISLLTDLREIDLHGNNISHVDAALFKDFTKLKSLDLRDNPITDLEKVRAALSFLAERGCEVTLSKQEDRSA